MVLSSSWEVPSLVSRAVLYLPDSRQTTRSVPEAMTVFALLSPFISMSSRSESMYFYLYLFYTLLSKELALSNAHHREMRSTTMKDDYSLGLSFLDTS
jgi:hypothetical protein